MIGIQAAQKVLSVDYPSVDYPVFAQESSCALLFKSTMHKINLTT